MKSITKKITLLLVLSATLFLSSCLDSGSKSYIGNNEYSLITRDGATGLVYARTAAANYITSPEINLLNPGTVAFLSYQITDETETISIGKNGIVHKVNLGAKPDLLDQKEVIRNTSAPETDTVYFESVIAPPLWITNSSPYFGDRWPFTYQFKAKKGENASVSFYQVPKDKHPENLNADMLIDIRLEIFGTPQENAQEELKNDLIVANMSRILPTPSEDDDTSDLNNTETEKLNIKYRYFIINSKKEPELYISAPITILVPKTTPK